MKSTTGVWLLTGLLGAAPAVYAAGDPAVLDAVRRGDVTAMRALLKSRADVNAPSPDGTTALHWAASRNDVEAVNLLIRAGADVKKANRYGVTPLLLACETGGPETVQALLKAGASANESLPEGETALMVAARSDKPEVLKLLVASGATVDAREKWRGQTAMMWAAAEGHAGVIKTLVELGADVKARTDGGFTPFLFAARAGRIEAVKALLAAGADINDAIQPKGSPTPTLMSGVTVGGATALRPSGNGAGTSALILALMNKRWDLAVTLVESGADPNDARVGWAPLHELAYIRRPNLGKGLPSAEEREYRDTLEVAKALIDRGAHVNARQAIERRDGARNDLNRVGATPLLLAAKHADVPFMKFLASHGADPKIATGDDTSLLMAASGVGVFNVGESAGTNEEAFEATKLAWELGSTDVNAADATGWTALHGATKRGSRDITRFLIEQGYSAFDSKTKEGWTALRIADGVFVGATVKRSDETAELIREMMRARGLTPPEKVVNDVADRQPAK
ncbi:MAG: hypothetical protein FJW27_01880 [Acidimicrobiia bacterium]|nr:hypothetical protein [Acidimicrobiia bacterium]